MERNESSARFPIGSMLPTFSLPATDGSRVTEAFLRGAPASLVVFACNHCPYVIGSEQMLFDTIRHYQARGLKAVIISSNDPVQYPEDSFEKMKEKAGRDQIPCHYLFDESQEVAKSFDAQCTPECFLFDSTGSLAYHGGVNNSPRDPSRVDTNFLHTALGQLLDGKKPSPAFAHPIGCSIKWKV